LSEQENIGVVRRYFDEVWNRGNLDAADGLVAPNFGVEGCGGAISGLEAVKLYVSSYRTLFPAVHFTMLSLIAEGDLVAACWVSRGLQSASCSEEAPATANCAPITGLSVYRIANGKIAEAWAGSEHGDSGSAQRLGIRPESTGETI